MLKQIFLRYKGDYFVKFTRRQIAYFAVFIILITFLNIFKLPYYIYKPGRADSLEEIVKVDGGYESEGSMHLLTVSGSHATPIQYVLAQFLSYREIIPIEDARPQGETDEEYLQRQLYLMENSQQSSTVVAYEAANADIEIVYDGVYVASIKEDFPADGVLEIGDIITSIDGKKINESDQLLSYIEGKEVGESISLDIEREDDQLTKTLELVPYEEAKSGVGIGIGLVTSRHVEVEPDIHFSSGNIGGPSAGLMFALDIYDQLTEEDLTKGYRITGTGGLDYDGTVFSIGGVDKKVVAAHKSGCEIFFVPNAQNEEENSNYQVAKATAEEIGTNMTIVPVDTFEEALTYLQKLEAKK